MNINNKKKTNLLFIAMIAAGLSACDDNDSTTITPTPTPTVTTQAVTDGEIQGAWTTGCVDNGNGTAFTDVLSFLTDSAAGSTAAYKSLSYATADCSDMPTVSDLITGTYALGLSATVPTGDASKIDYAIDGVVDPMLQLIAMDASGNRYTGDDTTVGADGYPLALNSYPFALVAEPTSRVVKPDLEGTWRSNCVSGGMGSQIMTVTFDTTTAAPDTHVPISGGSIDSYATSDCSDMPTSTAISGSVDLYGNVAVPTGAASQIDFCIGSCGGTPPKDLMALTTSGTLIMGNTNDLRTDGYPKELLMSTYFTKLLIP